MGAASSYRSDIDGLRAIAILSVVIFHAFPTLLPGGFVGVDIFFVISGFLITKILDEEVKAEKFSLIKFYIRRIKRIFPALIFVLFFVYIFGWFNFLSDDYSLIGRHIAAGASFTSNFLSWSESGYFDQDSINKPLLHLWSLAIEEQFYIFWPILIWAIYQLRLDLLKITLLCIAFSFLWGLIEIQSDHTAAFFSPFSRVWELMIGALLVKLIKVVTVVNFLNRFSGYLSYLGLGLILFSISSINDKSLFPGIWAILPVSGAALVILSGNASESLNRFLSSKVLISIGLISYPLYLWHWPLLSIGNFYWANDFADTRKIQMLLVALVLSIITYIFLEKPIRFGKRFLNLKLVILCFLMLFIGVMGYSCYLRDGIPMRHRDFVKEISSYQYDKVKEQQQKTCFLMDKEDSPLSYINHCSTFKDGEKIVLWGDSHAGSLYPGIKSLENNFIVSVVQFSLAGCGGLMPEEFDPPYCFRANQIAFNQIRQVRPNYVLLHKHWSNDNLPRIGKVIDELNNLKVKVILIGPTPTWTEDVPKLVYKYWKNNNRLPPEYFSKGVLLEESRRIDAHLANLAKEKKISFYSILNEFCNETGCRVVIPGIENALSATDSHHITPAAAIFGVANLGAQYFPIKP